MRLGRLAVIFTISVFFSPVSNAQTMSLPGQFSVSETGAATYTIPIEVPPGVAGMEPKLALVYNSQSGNGLLGMGWSLSGLSAITRCPRTMAQDGVRGGINYDLNDRYCLDGQRLILVSGTEGGNGAEYRTERESFDKIVAYTDPANTGGPAKFLVKTKAGLTMEYGYTPDSRIEVWETAIIRTWAISRIFDKSGNSIDFSYTKGGGSGAFYPKEIKQLSSNSEVKIEFILENNPHLNIEFQSGVARYHTHRISSIRVTDADANIGEYQMEYQVSIHRSRVNKIKKCLTFGECQEMVFLLQEEAGSVNFESLGTNGQVPGWVSSTANKFFPGDYNGDGRTDLLIQNSSFSTTPVLLSNGNGSWSVSNNQTPGWVNLEGTQLFTGDFNGDGKTDLILKNPTFTTLPVLLSNGNGTWNVINTYSTPSWAMQSSTEWHIGDYNGDSVSDILLKNAGFSATPVFFSNRNGTWSITNNTTPGWVNQSGTALYTGDFNGDGRTDFIVKSYLFDMLPVFFSNGNGTWTTALNQSPAWAMEANTNWHIVDHNGDGISDILMTNTGFLSTPVFLSKGNGQWSIYNNPTPSWVNQSGTKLHTGDFNGDGRTDFLAQSSLFTNRPVFLSLGNGQWQQPISPNIPASDLNNASEILIGDFDGDGRHDIAQPTALSGVIKNFASRISNGLEINSASNNFQTWEFDFLAATSSLVHSRSNSPSYPLTSLGFPIKLASAMRLSNGVGFQREVRYLYGNGVIDVGTGRGFLGFQWVQSEDVSTGLVSRTWYRQDWPFVGLVDKVERGTSVANRSNLGLTTYTYDCTDFDTTPGCLSAPGKRYFPYSTRVEEKRWDLNGTALPITRTDTIHDCISTSTVCFGNALDLTVSTLNPDGSPSGYSKRTQSQFYNDTNNWILGRLLKSSVIHTAP